ncbi:hypothetical protein GALMADRAFT_231507 [Galerina marginata CBS 339.88]|uniref:Uncharacterized protein n=1 Tax=Galerina marginata (strain CBS 339.88) TaxID=685588 RepID=A0A067SDK7_GALM3|nr:hypothetical protein GALMADRAFT_231507 [Galerina marginata CBS 339.88]
MTFIDVLLVVTLEPKGSRMCPTGSTMSQPRSFLEFVAGTLVPALNVGANPGIFRDEVEECLVSDRRFFWTRMSFIVVRLVIVVAFIVVLLVVILERKGSRSCPSGLTKSQPRCFLEFVAGTNASVERWCEPNNI